MARVAPQQSLAATGWLWLPIDVRSDSKAILKSSPNSDVRIGRLRPQGLALTARLHCGLCLLGLTLTTRQTQHPFIGSDLKLRRYGRLPRPTSCLGSAFCIRRSRPPSRESGCCRPPPTSDRPACARREPTPSSLRPKAPSSAWVGGPPLFRGRWPVSR